jgi:hypothetical protein
MWVKLSNNMVASKEKGERVLVAEKKRRKTEGSGWFFVNFGLNFPLLQTIKPVSIYRRSKRVIFSTQGKKFQPLIRLGRISTIGSK